MQNFGTQWSKSSSESISVCCIRSFGKERELGHLYVCVYRFKFIHIFTYGVGTHHSVGIGFVPNVSIYKMMVFKCRTIRNWPMLPLQNDDWLFVPAT